MSARILEHIFAKLTINNTDAAIELLKQLPIDALPSQHSDQLLCYLLLFVHKLDNKPAAISIISEFDSKRGGLEPLPIVTKLFIMPELSKEVLQFVVKAFSNRTAQDYYLDLINMGDDNMATTIAMKLLDHFPNMSHDDWDKLYHLTDNVEDEEYENVQLRHFLKTKAMESVAAATGPTYVKKMPRVELGLFPNFNMPSVKEAVDLIIENMKKSEIGDKEKELMEALIAQYSIAVFEQRRVMLSGIVNIPKFDDRKFFREFGPVNTQYREDKDDKHICSKYGGCRMFLCTEFEDKENPDDMTIEEHVHEVDWFRGTCDECLKPITKRHHALRFPLTHGGWRGCYCSLNCLKPRVMNPVEALTVGYMMGQLERFGIRDR